MSECVVPICDRPVQIKFVQMCSAHYQQQRDGRPITVPRVSSLVRDGQGRKRCRMCRGWFPENSFGANGRSLDGLATYCLTCIRAKQRATLEQQRDRSRLRRFNMSREQFDALLASQGGVCAICQSDSPGTKHHWCVDHDHRCCPERGQSCGECVRGILCTACNKAIGLLRDEPAVIARALDYLDRRLSIEPERMSMVRGV